MSPNTNGLSHLFNQNIGWWGHKKNETEISSYAGDILANKELRTYVQDVSEYQDLVQQLSTAKKQLQEVKNQGGGVETQSALQKWIDDMNRRMPSVKQAADVAVTYLDSHLQDKTPDRDIPIYTKIANIAMGQYGRTPVEYKNGMYSPTI
jgi:hypothetical protein